MNWLEIILIVSCLYQSFYVKISIIGGGKPIKHFTICHLFLQSWDLFQTHLISSSAWGEVSYKYPTLSHRILFLVDGEAESPSTLKKKHKRKFEIYLKET